MSLIPEFEKESQKIKFDPSSINKIEASKGKPHFVSQVLAKEDSVYQWMKNVSLIQASISIRLKWIEYAKKCLEKTPIGIKKKMGLAIHEDDFLSSFYVVNNDNEGFLGKGKYGFVYRAVINNELCNYVPVAIKVEVFENKEMLKNSKFESLCLQKANELVNSKKNIHFTYILDQFQTEEQQKSESPKYYLYTVMEFAQGNLESLMKWIKFDPKVLFQFYCQIVFTLLDMAVEHHMTHGDLYFRNILYNITNQNLEYTFEIAHVNKNTRQFENKRIKYRIPPINLVLKLADFGFCSAGDEKRIDLVRLKEEEYILKTMKDLNDAHIYFFKNVPKFMGDILSVTNNFYIWICNRGQTLSPLIDYFKRVVELIISQIHKDPLWGNEIDLHLLIQHIFSTEFASEEFFKLVQMRSNAISSFH